eukprot:TRINITY_DN774430_c0_g1_i1.p1 TRINITY_DN774430_c0_g1~~TRINITY_DN774430_c0_g1_i1.p1  ORF type:complete len:210 (+),score=85.33 TRINITY_DN774430_c0_g1_i1:44-673(+)
MPVKHPPVLWAQRANALYVTIDLRDVSDAKVEVMDDNMSFKGISGGEDFEISLEFFAPVDASAEESKYEVKPRNVQFHIVKKEEGSWPRLLKDKLLSRQLTKTDWSRYVDEDDSEAEEDPAGDFDMSALQNFQRMQQGGSMPSMPGMPMGGASDMGGMGGMDMAALMKSMQGMGGHGANNDSDEMPALASDSDDDSDDSDIDDLSPEVK